MLFDSLILKKGVRKGEELKAPRYASAAAIRDYITTRDIIPIIIYTDLYSLYKYLVKLNTIKKKVLYN